MLKERRFAIVIGINDYDDKPLDFCVNDAESVKELLSSKCLFDDEDIYLITSSTEKPVKDITGHLENALSEISEILRPNDDSIFFFFAGHGKYQFDNSGLKFHDSYMEIRSVFERINTLNPKYQFYFIDACESGGKVLTRGADRDVFSYIAQSSGVLFMYASTEEEKAREYSDKQHGLFTYYFLKAVNSDQLYDDKGSLTPNRIHDFIAKETLEESGFKQTPVIENRTIGYYPFAFSTDRLAQLDKKTDMEKVTEHEDIDVNFTSTMETVYFPEVPIEVRRQVFDEWHPVFDQVFDRFLANLSKEGYVVQFGNDFSVFPGSIQDDLTDSVVQKSISSGVVSLAETFGSTKELVKPNPMLGMIEALTRKKEYHYYNHINWGNDRVLAKSLYLKSENAVRVSAGISVLVYHALYGIGVVVVSFYEDYNGYSNLTLKGPYCEVQAFKMHNETVKNIHDHVISALNQFPGDLFSWNESRAKAIEVFDQNSI